MLVVIFLSLLSKTSSSLTPKRTCVPNLTFLDNGHLCLCNALGDWNETDCVLLSRRVDCEPGKITSIGCVQCICRENRVEDCNDTGCNTEATDKIATDLWILNGMKDTNNNWCIPYKSYYMNCSICVCPASGKISEAYCTKDTSCNKTLPSSSDFILSVKQNICIPNVMYLFMCLRCLCSDGGYFVLDKCEKTCQPSQSIEPTRRCISKTFYRKNCNVCWCPDDSIPDDKLCTRNICGNTSKFLSLEILKSKRTKCRPYSFLSQKCYFCGCNTKGKVNEDACLELDCLKTNEFKYDVGKTTCSPGEMVPTCTECFCLRNGFTNKTYCSDVCSYQNKLSVLENVLKDNTNHNLLDRQEIKQTPVNEMCEPNSMYLDQGRYCLCPENGSAIYKLCTSVIDEDVTTGPDETSISCVPNTFVEIDCNTCFCSKSGKTDPKWCTYDDCKAKKIIRDTHKLMQVAKIPPVNGTCISGSLSKIDCNFCICPANGLLKDRVCTNEKCSEISERINDDKFVCEPLQYYLVDCNVCMCPRDGIKNIEKCTKEICEKTFLRSDSCLPGQFFSRDCDVCVCPPSGDRASSICTKHRCLDSETPWKKIFRLSRNLLNNRIPQDSNRNLDVCFSGEEFEDGCKICLCPDVGLRSFATCSNSLCEEENRVNASKSISKPGYDRSKADQIGHIRSRRNNKICTTLNTTSYDKVECTPGSMYIIRCRQCICPYMGNINEFCRPLPEGTYCEEAFPNFNYLPMGRRTDEVNSTSSVSPPVYQPMNHEHTKYNCDLPGRVLDDCFICVCEEKSLVIIREHCFQSDADRCKNAEPSFLDKGNITLS